ncbi:phage portal protein [Corynebacterium lubricantis]|uniref:phage portal protein n=1 Tax=Corynebacterium lubricantis TaxID=541095 RepID=UPI00039E2C84|nr:phage portal protein [Corynebacterium lubricantis]
MNPSEIKELFDRLKAKLDRQGRDCDAVDSWTKPELDVGFQLPRKATMEHRQLAKLSRTPWLKLVVDNVVQAMYVDSITGSDGPSKDAWRLWMRNGLQSRQVANHRSMVSYGHSYGVVSAADRGETRLRFLSPRRMAVEFADLEDPYPSAALEVVKTQGKKQYFILRVPGLEYRLSKVEQDGDTEMEGLAVGEPFQTGLAYVPVVQFANQRDLDGNVSGEVLPLIPAAKRINKTSYDRLLAQHYNSWKVKTVTGLDMPEELDEDGDPTGELDREATERLKMKLGQDDILVGESPDTKFGTLDATALDPFVNSWRSDIEGLRPIVWCTATAW